MNILRQMRDRGYIHHGSVRDEWRATMKGVLFTFHLHAKIFNEKLNKYSSIVSIISSQSTTHVPIILNFQKKYMGLGYTNPTLTYINEKQFTL